MRHLKPLTKAQGLDWGLNSGGGITTVLNAIVAVLNQILAIFTGKEAAASEEGR